MVRKLQEDDDLRIELNEIIDVDVILKSSTRCFISSCDFNEENVQLINNKKISTGEETSESLINKNLCDNIENRCEQYIVSNNKKNSITKSVSMQSFLKFE